VQNAHLYKDPQNRSGIADQESASAGSRAAAFPAVETPCAVAGLLNSQLQMISILIYNDSMFFPSTFQEGSIKDDEMRKTFAYMAVLATLMTAAAQAADGEVALTIKDHQFSPAEIKVATNQRIKLSVHNQDSTPEEFESHSLNREKLIPAGAKAVIYIGPLKSGRYEFFGEFNPTTAKGVVVAE
jgi:hypothetical protein